MKKVFLLIIFIFLYSVSFAQTQEKRQLDLGQYGIRIESEKRLIIVMASLEAAEIETPLSETGQIFRKDVRKDLETLNSDLRLKIKSFIGQYKRRFSEKYKNRLNAEEAKKFDVMMAKNGVNLSEEEKPKYKAFIAEFTAPFVSLAFALSPVPDLSDPLKTDDLPGELLEVFDYSPLVREFYRRSGIDARLNEYTKKHDDIGGKMFNPAAVMSLNLLDYLHTRPELNVIEKIKTQSKDKNKTLQQTEIREKERRFFIIPDLFGLSNIARFRNVGDDYYVIVPPDSRFDSSEIRRSYLQFTLDTMVLRNGKEISQFREGIKQLLLEREKAGAVVSTDVFLAVTRSLVAASDIKQKEYAMIENATFEARLKIDKTEGIDAKKAVSAELNKLKEQITDESILQLSEAYESGAVLAFYFAEQLKQLEGGGFDISSYLTDMLASIDINKEKARLTQFADVRKRGLLAREERKKLAKTEIVVNAAEVERQKSLQKKLGEVQSFLDLRKYEEAETLLNQMEKDFTDYLTVIFYTKGRVASAFAGEAIDETFRDERLERAMSNYGNAIRSATQNTDKAVLSLSYVGLGKIYEFYEKPALAIKQYDEAIKLGNVSKGGYAEAVARKAKLTPKQ
ncbi:MAG: hypothetical protein MUC29_14420 [Pyrinomonadaceae bacterium]|nr:hypothetical protein [Pyrinomonadaceae bacterium]